ncbi:MAG: acetoacetate--CoA ligase, partial [Pseudomonadales bacterium]|nr:acetoacetate--CoA ligase [Pseudomonadales bacterium]
MTDEPLWIPSADRVANSQMTQFLNTVEKDFNLTLDSYRDLHQWSVNYPAQFWKAIWSFCDIQASVTYEEVLIDEDKFPGAKWFTGSRLNFAENLLRFRDDRIAIVGILENGDRRSISYAELFIEVEKMVSAMRHYGIKPGDRIAGFMPNVIETVVAMLATTSIGAIWSSCSPDFGINGVCDRFGQISPRILFTADVYYYNGKTINCLEKVESIQRQIEGIEKVVVVPLVDQNPEFGTVQDAVLWNQFATDKDVSPLEFEQLPFDHPAYIMYSSGTTGVPKCIVHGAGGTLVQHVKEHRLHVDITPDDVLFYYTTCGWMMWNWLVSGLASGATIVLYDGSPFANEGGLLLDAIDNEGITVFGTSAKFVSSLDKAGVKPSLSHSLSSLKTLLSTGSPLSQESFDYIYRDFKHDVCLSSICGGTDIISCFILGNPMLPVYRGEIQCLGLGMAVDFWDEAGQPIREEKGELVCTVPFPSAPIGFWNDAGDAKFISAYFDSFSNIWAQGDYGEITEHGGIIIHGRSDAVLNPGGVRIGTAEIYRQVEKVDAVIYSIVVGQDWEDDTRVILFVVLREGLTLNDDIINEL